MTRLLLVALLVLAMLAATPSGPDSVSFAELGWEEDVVVTASSAAILRFELPEDHEQGTPLWYGVHLEFTLEGDPGEVGDYVLMSASWNGATLYQFKTKKIVPGPGFHWSMVDLVSGSSRGYELTDQISVKSRNIAQDSAIQGGTNELRFYLRDSGAGNEDIRAVISKESRIIATSWQPTQISGESNAEVSGKDLDLRVAGRNIGWGAPNLKAKVVAWYGRDSEVHTRDLGALEPAGRFEFEEKITLTETPKRVDVELDWGSGRQFYIVWEAGEESVAWHSFFRSSIGIMLAVTTLWIAVPLLVERFRGPKNDS